MRYELTDALTDLLGQPITERGVNAMLFCPFHENTRTKAFSVHLDEGVWYCFGCGRKGNLEQLYSSLGEGMDPDVYLKRAVRRAESTSEYTPKPTHSVLARDLHRNIESVAGQVAMRDFVSTRPVDPAKVIGPFLLGYDPGRAALAFPYFDTDGRCTGIKFRDHRGNKYSQDDSHFGFFGPSVIGKSQVVICEGESDTLAVFSALDSGYSVCGTSGASLSEAQWTRFAVDLLFAERVFLAYDADDPGDQCSEIAMRVLGVDKCQRVRPIRGKDVSEHLLHGGNLDELGLGTADIHVRVP